MVMWFHTASGGGGGGGGGWGGGGFIPGMNLTWGDILPINLSFLGNYFLVLKI
jgi:hypothetical protein